MQSLSKILMSLSLIVFMWPQLGKAERNKYETALAADVWNSFANRDELEVFLATKKSKADRAAIKTFVSAFSKVLPLAVLKGDTIQFGEDKTKWAIDSSAGVWLNDDVYVPSARSSFAEKIENFKKWNKNPAKTSMFQLWVQPAHADVDDATAKAMYASFMDEFGKLMNKDCMFSMAGTALKELPATKVATKEVPSKITSVGIVCHDQNPAKETIFTVNHGANTVLTMNGQFAKSESTDKEFLKKVRIEMNGENRVNVNFIEAGEGSEHHTTEIRYQSGAPMEVLSKNEARSKAISACTADLSQRMILAINKVCSSIKASSYVQRGFGQMSGAPPEKAVPAEQEKAQAK